MQFTVLSRIQQLVFKCEFENNEFHPLRFGNYQRPENATSSILQILQIEKSDQASRENGLE